MEDSTLTRIRVPGPVSRPDLRYFAEALRTAWQMPGCRAVQTFRGIDRTSELLVLARWRTPAAATRGAVLLGAIAPARGAGEPARAPAGASPGQLGTVALRRFYEVTLLRREPAAVLLRLAVSELACGAAVEAKERELALRALAEPGSIRVEGARSRSRALFVCRVEFDIEDALWHFLESPLCREWARLAGRLAQSETWALNLPRLARERSGVRAGEHGAPGPALTARAASPAPASVQLTVSDAAGATLHASGRLDAAGATKLRAVARSLVRAGSRRLELDICRLDGLTPEALAELLATVREAKMLGAEVRLIEGERRFARATRAAHLERSVPAMAAAASGVTR